MLKKAGIVVAGTAAALLAVSPLAFAGDKGKGGPGHDTDVSYSETNQVNAVGGEETNSTGGLIAIGDIEALNNVNVCPAIPVGVGVGNLLGILGSGTATNDQTATGACVNDNSVNQSNAND